MFKDCDIGEYEKFVSIVNAGLVYSEDTDMAELKIIGGIGNSRWSVIIPTERIKDFVKIFPEIDWYSEFLHRIVGRHIRIVVDADIIVALKHPYREIVYSVE